ncbi:MAG TPA: ABC transporter ATP-binding protein [Terriglobia bacterium]|nr:ABC transporter ATP-binding protein [Terriglobia bacterium]
MSKTAISVQNLTKVFPTRSPFRALFGSGPAGKEVLKGMSLEVRQGEVLGLLGPNGAGKTTFLEVLSTLLLPTHGRVSVCGYDVVGEAAQVRKVLSYCPSAMENFYPRLTGARNLEFFGMLHDLTLREAKDRAQQMLGTVGIDGAKGVPFQRYSDGMKQRLALARALLSKPEVLVLDEPTRGLDPVFQQEIRKFLRQTVVEKLGKTVILVTHSLAEAEEVADRLVILHEGRIAGEGTPEELRKTFGSVDLSTAFARAVGASPWE